MNRFLKTLTLTGLIASVLAFKTAYDFLQTLGISKEEASDYVWYSFQDGNFNYPYSDDYKSLSTATRVSLVKEIGEFAKVYSRTDDFKKRYSDYRLTRKPAEPEAPQTTQEMKDQYKKDLQENIAEMEKNIENASGEVRTALQTALKTMKDQLVQIDDPNNPMFSQEVETARQQYYEGQKQQYEEELSQWKVNFPEDPVKMIKDRLNYFLQVSSTVDFNARISKNQYGTYVFDNPDYESKPSEWKMIYRAGRESTDAARQFAQGWLKELP